VQRAVQEAAAKLAKEAMEEANKAAKVQAEKDAQAAKQAEATQEAAKQAVVAEREEGEAKSQTDEEEDAQSTDLFADAQDTQDGAVVEAQETQGDEAGDAQDEEVLAEKPNGSSPLQDGPADTAAESTYMVDLPAVFSMHPRYVRALLVLFLALVWVFCKP
jgi:phage repressor protein C with HTH and peptisase S24 domain